MIIDAAYRPGVLAVNRFNQLLPLLHSSHPLSLRLKILVLPHFIVQFPVLCQSKIMLRHRPSLLAQ